MGLRAKRPAPPPSYEQSLTHTHVLGVTQGVTPSDSWDLPALPEDLSTQEQERLQDLISKLQRKIGKIDRRQMRESGELGPDEVDWTDSDTEREESWDAANVVDDVQEAAGGIDGSPRRNAASPRSSASPRRTAEEWAAEKRKVEKRMQQLQQMLDRSKQVCVCVLCSACGTPHPPSLAMTGSVSGSPPRAGLHVTGGRG